MRFASASILCALAFAGCGDGGDAANLGPPPLVCADVVSGQTLGATATADASTLTVAVSTSTRGVRFFGPLVNDLSGLKERSTVIASDGTVQVVFARAADTGTGAPPTSAQFTLRAKLISDNNQCDLQRTFKVNIAGVSATVM